MALVIDFNAFGVLSPVMFLTRYARVVAAKSGSSFRHARLYRNVIVHADITTLGEAARYVQIFD
jgi:hypothetical protein